MKKAGFTTKALHTEFAKNDPHNALHMPIYDGVAFEFESAEEIEAAFLGKKTAHAYSRTSNPTVEHFERKMKALTDAHAAIALSSGMAAISNALMALVELGGNIIASNHLFGHSYALLRNTLPDLGIEVRWADTSDIASIEVQTDDKTRVVFLETITNPQLEVSDLKAISAFTKANGIVLAVDSTITPPYVFDSKTLGVDVELMSTTKFVSGGAAAIGGVVLDNGTFDWSKLPNTKLLAQKLGKDAFQARVRKEIFRQLGGTMMAHTAHFMNLGLDIMALRIDRCVENCLQLGAFFQKHSKVQRVDYPGLKEHAGYELAQTQFKGKPGGVMTFDLESKEACFRFYNALKIVRRATNLNDNKSLIIHPHSTIYSEFSEEERQEMGIRDTMLRLSVGIEDIGDLMVDFDQALSAI